jgi:hypothetical protein
MLRLELALGIEIHGAGRRGVRHQAGMGAAMDIGGGDEDETARTSLAGGFREVDRGIDILAAPSLGADATPMAEARRMYHRLHRRELQTGFGKVSGDKRADALVQRLALTQAAEGGDALRCKRTQNGAADIPGRT